MSFYNKTLLKGSRDQWIWKAAEKLSYTVNSVEAGGSFFPTKA